MQIGRKIIKIVRAFRNPLLTACLRLYVLSWTVSHATPHAPPLAMAALATAPLQSRAFLAGGALRARAPRAVAVRVAAPTRAGIFDFLTPKPAEESASASSLAYICVDCGYIYKCALRLWGAGGVAGARGRK